MRFVAAPFPQKANAFRGPHYYMFGKAAASFLRFRLQTGNRTREGVSVKPECPANIPAASGPKATERGAEEEVCERSEADGQSPMSLQQCKKESNPRGRDLAAPLFFHRNDIYNIPNM